jgi:pectinesterase
MKRFLLASAALLCGILARGSGFTVAADGSGDFRTVQEAVNAAPDYCKQTETLITIKAGIYREKVTVPASKQRLHLVGEGAERTIITWDDYALRSNAAGFPMGTSATSTVFIYGSDFLAEGLTFENSAGEGKDIAQACAVTVDADRVAFIGCRFLGNQDTIYTYGKGQRQYWRDCWIEGTTDFIFGASTCWFEGCTILCKKDSYITAASTPEGAAFGYVFKDCRVLAAPGVTKCYLGRPWRKFARTVWIDCRMDSHIRPEGWHDWSKPYAHRTVFYAESGSTGPGAAGPRVKWARRLSARQLKAYTPARVMDAGTEEDKNGTQVPVEWFFKVF